MQQKFDSLDVPTFDYTILAKELINEEFMWALLILKIGTDVLPNA